MSIEKDYSFSQISSQSIIDIQDSSVIQEIQIRNIQANGNQKNKQSKQPINSFYQQDPQLGSIQSSQYSHDESQFSNLYPHSFAVHENSQIYCINSCSQIFQQIEMIDKNADVNGSSIQSILIHSGSQIINKQLFQSFSSQKSKQIIQQKQQLQQKYKQTTNNKKRRLKQNNVSPRKLKQIQNSSERQVQFDLVQGLELPNLKSQLQQDSLELQCQNYQQGFQTSNRSEPDRFQREYDLSNNLAVLQIQRGIGGQNTVQMAELSKQIGIMYKTSGDYDKALNYLDKSIKFTQQNLQQSSFSYIQAFCWVIRTQINKGNYKQSLKLCKQKSFLALKLLGTDNLLYSDLLHFTGIINSYLGNKEEALKYFNESLKIQKKIDQNQDKINQTFSQIAINQCQMNKIYEANLKMNQIKSLMQKNISKNYSIVSEIILHFGSICKLAQNYQGALQNYQICLKIRKKFYGPQHPKVVRVLSYIGQIYLLKKDHEKALQILFKSLQIMNKTMGKNSSKSYHILMMIGQTYLGLGNNELALNYLIQSKQKISKIFDNSHPHYGQVLQNIGKAYKNLRDFDASLTYLNECPQLKIKNFGQKEQYKKILDEIQQVYRLKLNQTNLNKKEC